MIKNIVFDVGNVLVYGKNADLLQKLDLTKEEEEEINNTFMVGYFELDYGKITIKEFVDSCHFSEGLKQKYETFFLEYYKHRKLNHDMLAILPKLVENGYKIYLLSDNNKEAFEYWYSLPEFKDISGYTVSYEHQTVKKNKDLFRIFFEENNLIPEECFFIDDKQINIDISKEFGMNGIVYDSRVTPFKDFIKEMEKNGIKI